MTVSILGGGMGGFTHIFGNSPLFFSEAGEKSYLKRKKEKDKKM
jgi:hypothetical protein